MCVSVCNYVHICVHEGYEKELNFWLQVLEFWQGEDEPHEGVRPVSKPQTD